MRKASKLFAAAALAAVLAPAALAADLASDKQYAAKCAGCHGKQGEGNKGMKVAPMADAASKSEADLTTIIRDGKAPRMPKFAGKLTDDEIKTMVSEIKALKK